MPPKKDPKAEEAPKEPQPPPQPHELTDFGRFEYLSGAVYEGNWVASEGRKYREGYGRMTVPSKGELPGESYEGDWRQDQMEGFGTYHYPDGSVY
jgi:hypothetical protein